MKTEYGVHPLAEMFPEMASDDFSELVQSIKRQGLLEAIVLFDGKVLDGRSRLRACVKASVEPRFIEYDGNDPVRYVWAKNFARRHLNTAQKFAAIAVYNNEVEKAARKRMKAGKKAENTIVVPEAGSDPVANLPRGPSIIDGPGRTVEKLGEMAGISPKTVQSGLQAIKKAPELLEPMRSGELSVHAAAEIAKSPEVLEQIRSKEITVDAAVKAARARRKPLKPRRGPEGTHKWYTCYVAIVDIHMGADDLGRRNEMILAAWLAASREVGFPPKGFVDVKCDGVSCRDPFFPPPPPDGWRPDINSTVVECTVRPYDVELKSDNATHKRRHADAIEDDLIDDLNEAVGGPLWARPFLSRGVKP